MPVESQPRNTRGAVRLAWGVSALVAVAMWAVGCGEPQPPIAMGRIPALTVEVGNTESVDLTGYFSDADGDVLTYTARSSDPSVATAAVSGATIQVMAVAAGNATVTVTASDPGGLSANQTFAVTVPNRTPVAVGRIPDAETFVGESVEIELAGYFSDPGGDGLTYSAASSNPGVATVSVVGATLQAMGVGQGTATMTVTASDGSLSASQDFTVTVPNRGPEAVGQIDDAETFVGESVEIELAGYFSDPGGDGLTYSAASSNPGVATVSVVGATLQAVGVGQGTATMTVTASDPGGLSATQTFSVTVANRAPEAVGQINDAETFVDESVEIELAGYFSDPDGDDLAYSATSSNTGVVTVSVVDATLQAVGVAQGSATVAVTATDVGGLTAEQDFAVTVPNRAPEVVDEIDDVAIFEDVTVNIALADYFDDPDGDDLAYSASSSDNEVATVTISGDAVAVTGVAAGSADITVTASDGSLSASQNFTASVRDELTDRDVLEILYDSTDGDNWLRNTNWKSTAPLDDWWGISTDSSGRVATIVLYTNNLSGSIPAELGDLANLEFLGLGNLGDPDLLPFNELTGSIPSELGDLANLEFLDLSINELTGSIPAELGDLANLKSLSLVANQLTGSIPAELSGLANLELLNLASNALTGSIPSELGELANLEWLSLGPNALSGSIPSELGDLANLKGLSLFWNALTGSIPAELGDLSSLEALRLGQNELTGSIPAELGDLSSLEVLFLEENELTGSIPAELGDLANLEELYLHSNQLTGSIPAELGDLADLEELYLHSNQLTGSTPNSFLDLTLGWFTFDVNDGLCVPNTDDFDKWLDKIEYWRGPRC